ncbi:OB-fold domain-containing protein [Myxococcota bacterium]|nr:OB-fold domain-containing protein [Myxococcota bacterium]
MASLTAVGADEIGSKGTGDEFYAWCARGELRLRRCNACREWCHVPRLTCPNCASTDWAWEPVKGTGRLYTWTVVHRAMHPAFMGDVPYAVVVVELDEGPRIVSGMVDCPIEALEMEMPVEVVFERSDRWGDRVLPRFRRTAGGSSGKAKGAR